MKRMFAGILVFSLLINASVRADEGMWLLTMLNKTYAQMKNQGFKLTPEDIYSLNKPSLKDAIVIFGNGCTGELVSSQGLLLTNHHCGYGSIQALSSVEHDYLENGYWAKSKEEELACPGLSVTFLVRIEDVSDRVNSALAGLSSEAERNDAIRKVGKELSDNATRGTGYESTIRSFYGGNQFFLLVYERYTDVRFVGAPPSSIGKFGGDTDNWMWPRHTGDFSVFRVYASKDNKPSEFSKDNVPFKPRYSLPVSIKGVKENDYAMILGYPGRTTRYMTSFELAEVIGITDPNRAKIRGIRQEIMMKDMLSDEKIKIQYANKYAGSSNYWKYAIGEMQQLKQLKIVDKKVAEETRFTQWLNADAQRQSKFGDALSLIQIAISGRKELSYATQYYNEALLRGIELFSFANGLAMAEGKFDTDAGKAMLDKFRAKSKDFYKDYNPDTDHKIAVAMLQLFRTDVEKKFWPALYEDIQANYSGDVQRYVDDMFNKSLFVNAEKLQSFIDNPDQQVLENDMAYQAAKSVISKYRELSAQMDIFSGDLAKGQRLYIAGLMEMDKDNVFYPDANGTMRLTYGKVQDYEPRDGVIYKNITTLKGVIEKEDPGNWEFVVPARLKELYYAKDYGRYGQKGEMVTCFLSNNDITGGNSGSPIMNAKGELIGLAFDGNWEAMSGNISFDPSIQRTINVDIRYVLFIMDKFAGAKQLVDEMKIM
jgi:hypothetical protein